MPMELKEIQRLEGHTDRVWSLDWNPATGHDGIPLVFASCSGDKTVRIWEQNLSSGLWACKVFFHINFHSQSLRNSILWYILQLKKIVFVIVYFDCENGM